MKDFIDSKTKINFSAIIKSCPGLKELKNEDLKLKGDSYHSYEVQDKDKKLLRANAIFEVFPKLTAKGMELTDFISRLKTSAWFKKENFEVVENLGGKLLIKFVEGNTHAVIRFANSPGQFIALYFRVSDKATQDELFFYLKSEQPMNNGVQLRKFKVVEAALFIEVDFSKDLFIEGKIIKNVFMNKIGNPNPEIYDLYLKIKNKEYFIKFSESKYLRKELEQYLDQLKTYKILMREGAWDSDDPDVQSRNGEYVVILEIVK